MRITACPTIEQKAFGQDCWPAFQATVFVAGGSVLLWGMIFSLLRWLI